MASCLDIITYAMRQARIIGPGKSPKAAEAEEGMVALQSLYDQWRTDGMFGSLVDLYLEDDDIALEGYRYRIASGVTLTDATSVYLDENGVTREPRDLALYEAVTSAGAQRARLYDRTEWVDLLGLEQSDTAPLSARNAYGLAACLACDSGFCAMFGVEPSLSVVKAATNFRRNVMGKSGSTQDKIAGEYF